jgi:RNA polymerase sigma factor (TIGR02999 family)
MSRGNSAGGAGGTSGTSGTEDASDDRRQGADLLPQVYNALRQLAQERLRRLAPGQTLQATALVHEVYLRLLGPKDRTRERDFANTRHFFFAAARAMQDIIIEAARAKRSQKRGGGMRRLDVDQLTFPLEERLAARPIDRLALHEAIERLRVEQPGAHDIVLLRFFTGLTMQETAEVIGRPLRSVERDWRFVRAWLHRELSAE